VTGGPTLAILAVLTILTACQPTERFTVLMQDSAMEPTYSARALVHFRSAVRAGRGDVVAFEYPFPYPGQPRRELIARVIGLPGDRLELSSAGTIVNGYRLDEPYAKNQQSVAPADITVPASSYFVLGDDRANQRDSRWWGTLPAGKLLGVADLDP
jgi:signal peptidase I